MCTMTHDSKPQVERDTLKISNYNMIECEQGETLYDRHTAQAIELWYQSDESECCAWDWHISVNLEYISVPVRPIFYCIFRSLHAILHLWLVYLSALYSYVNVCDCQVISSALGLGSALQRDRNNASYVKNYMYWF